MSRIISRGLTPGQRALLRTKVHLEPGSLAQIPSHLAERLESSWHGAVLLIAQLQGLPETALHWWANQARGHIVITGRSDRYEPGTLQVGRRQLKAAAQVPLAILVETPHQAAILAVHPLDHLLGCHGDAEGKWLSQGGGLTPQWQEVGRQLAQLFALGYGLTSAGRADPHRYLAEGIVAALHARRELNVADPKLHRLLTATLLNDGYWSHWAPRPV